MDRALPHLDAGRTRMPSGIALAAPPRTERLHTVAERDDAYVAAGGYSQRTRSIARLAGDTTKPRDMSVRCKESRRCVVARDRHTPSPAVVCGGLRPQLLRHA